MAFQNELLSRLLDATLLKGGRVQLATKLMPEDVIVTALSQIPMDLSEKQQSAIIAAWQNEISYIQGPPGTGKSHTITALMLSAILLDKKVLLVSHKQAAIDVVRKNVNKKLDNPQGLIHIGSTTSERRNLRSYLQKLTSEVSHSTIVKKLEGLKREIAEDEQSISKQSRIIEENERRLRLSLDRQEEFFRLNHEFVKQRENFCRQFGLNRFELSREYLGSARMRANMAMLAKIEESADQTRTITRKSGLAFLSSERRYVRMQGADASLVRQHRGSYLRPFVELTIAFHASDHAQQMIPRDDVSLLRVQIESAKKKLRKDQSSHLVKSAAFKAMSTLFDLVHSRKSSAVQSFMAMLHWVNPRKIAEKMETIDYNHLTEVFPLWAGEIRDLGNYLSFAPAVFDLVVVDESSQVNLADIIPAFYRGNRFCVVGDKEQLGLSAAGLFSLNRRFEQLTWNRHFRSNDSISYPEARENEILVSTSSILDFITSPNNDFTIGRELLDEHFRSMPALASYTSEKYYNGELRIMTQVGENVSRPCFAAIKVNGTRAEAKKFVPAEIESCLHKLVYLIRHRGFIVDPQLSTHDFSETTPPKIGVISFLTEQRNVLRERVEEEFTEDEIRRHDLLIGTPEEFQGNEREIILITLGLDGTGNWGANHYQDSHRFNVATSRAKNFTYLIYGGIPANARRIKQYLNHFNVRVSPEDIVDPPLDRESSIESYGWRFTDSMLESEFERRVSEYLYWFVEEENNTGHRLRLYNQVNACNYFIDFVLYDLETSTAVGIEVDGAGHFDGKVYSDGHRYRVDVLKRAGWKLIHVPYFKWYRRGWLCDQNDAEFSEYIESFFDELRRLLFEM